MADFTFSGTPAATDSYCFGSLTIPTPQSVRETIRAAAAWGILNQISKANGYFNDIGEVNTQEVSYSKRKKFPSIDLLWGNETYLSNVPGGFTTRTYEKVAPLFIECWLDYTESSDMVVEREKMIADIEKYFGTYYYIPDENGTWTAFNCMLNNNVPFGMKENNPKGGVELQLDVYYRTDLTNPNLKV